jgi:hypothetical protein
MLSFLIYYFLGPNEIYGEEREQWADGGYAPT